MDKDLLLRNGIDFDNATVKLTGEVDAAMLDRVLLAASSLKEKPKVTFVLDTPGGCVYQAFGIYDLIKTAFTETKIICVGYCMSAGIIILSAGDERVSYPQTQFLVHYGEDSSVSTTEVKHNSHMVTRMKNVIKQCTNVKPRTINTWFTKETYFNAEHAKKIGLVERVVTYE